MGSGSFVDTIICVRKYYYMRFHHVLFVSRFLNLRKCIISHKGNLKVSFNDTLLNSRLRGVYTELKTLEWDILNPDRIWVSNVHTFDFNLNPSFWISLDYIKVTFDNNYRYNGISIGLISDWIIVRWSQASF